MEHYFAIRHLHITLALLSGAFFLFRGVLMLKQSAWLQHKICKIAPHIIDSGLLGAAIYLAVITHQSPGNSPWVAAKIGALLLYIVLGTIALKRGKTMQIRSAALIAALATYGYIVAVAITKNPLPWLA
ncbi:SirB2 family protein [Chitinibacter bivalviorum]|uniref:SirB2 family protein n=1 Tax=Chitinibacter bivalviorum TaxID=2739434 RepID=A0A7H9BLE9_9NEIS|nr:SirB2 family protein [Chitinibacter bivalviorum]QLG88851.1 SirB2 family protein [Chitinibacter bivalviorum]